MAQQKSPLQPPSSIAYQRELSKLATTLGLKYPDNPKQINKAVLILSYLMSKGMLGVMNALKAVTAEAFYIDSFSKEIFLLYYSNTLNVYTKSKEEIEYDLGDNAEKDLIEYKIRKELFKLVEENTTNIEDLKYSYYNFQSGRSERFPFSWVDEIKSGYYNVLLGGKNKPPTNNTNKIVKDLKCRTTDIMDTIKKNQPDDSKDSINK